MLHKPGINWLGEIITCLPAGNWQSGYSGATVIKASVTWAFPACRPFRKRANDQ
jgi:hypothetical protein